MNFVFLMHKLFKNRIFLILAGIIILFVVLNFIIPQRYFLDPFRNFVFRFSTPITRIFYKGGTKTGGFFDNISQIKNISDQKSKLEKRNAELEFENSKLKEVLKENEVLRAELDLKAKLIDRELVAADIIGRGPGNSGGSLILNKGKNDGLKEDMPVVSSGRLLGKLTEVGDDYSRLILIIDESTVVNVMVEETRASGVVKGEVGFNLIIDSIPQESPLKIGQRVITSGLGGTMPKGLIIGEVAEILSPQSEIFQSARIKPAADFNHLEIVFIIKT
ncbi:MAG: rod shape-determining protein MreC [Candidatus Berkelbacteria bacterium Licking1014_96]|uniref:Cell shape-determining protein MreC n=1 Tax=Candidatus Berkelbacteria bacterium Licking1014_96 TaxID=2017149 RepID=A0A554LH74_9BACT|nr:MAG: rod shape-determining protein MreC [Candidatus Berkelbacteria bacterium Licking1014_96]